MIKKELEDQKKELMKPGWTEDLHHALKELRQEDAKEIVESMTDKEIYSKVNNRQMQQDYIAGYLRYLWEISEPAFWRHVIITLELKKGILWSDNMVHFEKMCNTRISDEVLRAVLHFAIGVQKEENYSQDYEVIGCVVRAQVKKFNRLDDINNYISRLSNDIQLKAQNRIAEMVKNECNYHFP